MPLSGWYLPLYRQYFAIGDKFSFHGHEMTFRKRMGKHNSRKIYRMSVDFLSETTKVAPNAELQVKIAQIQIADRGILDLPSCAAF